MLFWSNRISYTVQFRQGQLVYVLVETMKLPSLLISIQQAVFVQCEMLPCLILSMSLDSEFSPPVLLLYRPNFKDLYN